MLRDFDLLVTGLMYKRASFGSAAKPGADYCAGLCSWHGEVSVRAAIRDKPAMADAGLGEDACGPVRFCANKANFCANKANRRNGSESNVWR